MDDVADWTRSPAGELVLDAVAGPDERSGRPVQVAGGGRVVATASLLLWNVLCEAYDRLGFDAVADEAFKALVLGRIIEPTSKADTLRVLAEIGVPPPSLRTVFPGSVSVYQTGLPQHARDRLHEVFGVHGGWAIVVGAL